MGKRFSDIARAKELEEALVSYNDWFKNRFDSTKRKTGGTVGPARKRVSVYVLPFSNAATVGYRTTRSVDSNVRFGATDGRISATPTGQNGGYNVFGKGQKPSRVHLFESSGSRAYVRSQITKLHYIKYAGDNYSTPIGRKTENEKEAAAVADTFTYLRGLAAGKDYVRVWHSPEDMVASRS